MSNYDPRGSEWRKWDLHVHTPESVLSNGFGADWDTYVKNLFTILVNKRISVVGITDYFNIDGYKKLTQEYLQNEKKLATLFRPSRRRYRHVRLSCRQDSAVGYSFVAGDRDGIGYRSSWYWQP